MIDIGLNEPDDYLALGNALGTIRTIEAFDENLAAPHELDEPGSDLRDLMDQIVALLPDGPVVDPRLTFWNALRTARVTLTQISDFMLNGIPTRPEVLQILARSALLGAGRIVFVFGPDEARVRLENAQMVMRQEAQSALRAYQDFADFEQFTHLVPPQEVLESQRERKEVTMAGERPIGEHAMLARMARVIGDIMNDQGHEDEIGSMIREHTTWIFNVFSGVSHAYGWPHLMPRTPSMPGHFISDLVTTANVTHLAYELTASRSVA